MNGGDNCEPVVLPKEEWAFHLVPQPELAACACWELDRHRGKDLKPWLALSIKEKGQWFLNRGNIFQQIPPEIGQLLTDWAKKASGQKTIPLATVSFLIDFRAAKRALLKHFSFWLDSVCGDNPDDSTSQVDVKVARRKPVPPKTNVHWRSILTHLVVYRTSVNACLGRKAAIQETAELWKAWELDQAKNGIQSPAHWSRALKKARGWKTQKLPLP